MNTCKRLFSVFFSCCCCCFLKTFASHMHLKNGRFFSCDCLQHDDQMFLGRFTNCYLAFTSLKLVLTQCSETLSAEPPAGRAQYFCSISVPRAHKALQFSPGEGEGECGPGGSLLPVPRRRMESETSRMVSGLGGSCAPFFLLGLRGLVLSGIRSIYSCEAGKQRAFSPASSKAQSKETYV